MKKNYNYLRGKMFGTIVNILAVITGSLIGLLLKNKLPKKIILIIFHALGLFTLFLGIKMALNGKQLLAIVFSLIVGGISGEFLKLDQKMEFLSKQIKRKSHFKNEKFSEGFITAFLMYCMGSLTILGAIQEGMTGDNTLLLTKSVMDGFSSIALASGLGIGVLFSVIPLFLYQGGLTLLSALLGDFFRPEIVTDLSATGGILLIGLGINILEIKKIKVLNLIPSLFFIIIFSYLASLT